MLFASGYGKAKRTSLLSEEAVLYYDLSHLCGRGGWRTMVPNPIYQQWRFKVRFWLCIVAVVLVDQWTKWMVGMNLAPGQSVVVVPKVMWFTHVFNRGAAFSMMQGQTIFFVVAAALVVLALMIYNLLAKPTVVLQIFTGMMAGGAAGNLLDRCRLGHVVDFIDFRVWPVFNVADMAIVCGGILLVIYFMWFDKDGQSDE